MRAGERVRIANETGRFVRTGRQSGMRAEAKVENSLIRTKSGGVKWVQSEEKLRFRRFAFG